MVSRIDLMPKKEVLVPYREATVETDSSSDSTSSSLAVSPMVWVEWAPVQWESTWWGDGQEINVE